MTVSIELIPTVSRCIETTAKGEYWRSVDEFLKKGTEDKELEQRIELLKTFLETADFSLLRGDYEEYLVQGKRVIFHLSVKNGKPSCEMTVDSGL